MINSRKKKTFKLFLILTIIVLIFRTCIYGSPLRSCIYTEKEIPLSPFMAISKIIFTKPAEIVRGEDKEYQCLPIMGKISNKIVKSGFGHYLQYQVINHKIDTISPTSNMELTPLKLISVTKHGIFTIDSGPGPITHLILKNQSGEIFELAIILLGSEKNDFFLKAINNTNEVELNSDTKFSE